MKLDTSYFDSDHGLRLAEAAPGAMPSVHTLNGWHQPTPDSIGVAWSTGYEMVEMSLEINGRHLVGSATTWNDGGSDTERASVTATWVDCSAPLAAEDQARYDIPRGIELVDGDSIRVDERLPDRWREKDQPTNRHLIVRSQVRGVFAGADTVRVSLTKGAYSVGLIELIYESGGPWPELHAALGAPTQVRHYPSADAPEREIAEWMASTIQIRVERSDSSVSTRTVVTLGKPYF